MEPQKILYPEHMDMSFLITLMAKLISVRPKIIAINSIHITAIKKHQGKYPYNYKAVVRGLQKKSGHSLVPVAPVNPDFGALRAMMWLPGDTQGFEISLLHREDCPWDIEGR